MNNSTETSPAARLLGRLSDFARDLDDDERELFAVLVGPGMQQLTNDYEVVGFGADTVRWEPGSLREQLATAVETSTWQIVEA